MDVNSLLTAKWSRFFDLLDENKDGLLEAKDFVAISEKIYVVYEANKQKMGMRVLLKRSDRLFNRLLFEMHLMGEGALTKEDWFKWLKTNLSQGVESRAYRRLTYQIFNELFTVCDQNKDGFLSREELADLYHIFGIEETDASMAFRYIDENNDGKISKAEFLEGIREYFTNIEEEQTVFGEVKA